MIVLWDLDGTLLLDNSPEGGLGVFAQALREVSGHEPVSIPDRHGKVDWQILDEIRQGAGLPVSFAGPLTRRFKELSQEWYSTPANAWRTRARSSGVSTPAAGIRSVTCTAIG